MRREEYCVNPTIDGFKQESDYTMHVIKLQKAKTVINTTPIEPPPHFKQQKDYNQKLRKDMFVQSEFLRSLIPTKENPLPHQPKVRDYNEIFRNKKSNIKKSSRKAKNRNHESPLPSQFFLTENHNQKYMTPTSAKRPINYYDFDKESYSPTGETILSVQSDSTDYDHNINESPVPKNQIKKQKELSEKFNSRYYKPSRLNETGNSEDDTSNNGQTYRFNLNSNDNLTGIEVDDNDFDYDLILKSSKNHADKNRSKSTPKPNSSRNKRTNNLSDTENTSSSNEKKDDSISEAFVSNNNSPTKNKQIKNKSKESPIKKTKKYPISPSQQLAKLDQSKSSTPISQSEKRMIRVKRKRIIRRRIPKTKQSQEEEEEMLQKPLINYTYAKTTNGKPYQILFLKPGDPLPPNSAIIQIDTTRTVIVRSISPLEIIETDNSSSLLNMPMNSILICPNQKNLLKKYIVKKTSISSPTMSSFVVTSIDDKPLHFIYINPDREVPPNSFLVHRDSRIRVAVQGQLRISQIKLGDPLPPNSIRVPSFINQPRRTVCVVSQDEEKLNFVTVRSGEEFQLPRHSIIVHSDKFTKTAVVSENSKPLEYISVQEGGKIPQNSVVLSTNVIKKKPPKVAVFPTKSSNTEDKKEERFLSFINVKNGDEMPLNSIVVESDDQNILALAPFDETQKIQSILINESDELPEGALLVDLSQAKMIPNLAVSSDEPLNIATFTNKNDIPKDSVILKEDDKAAVALIPPQNQLLYASTKNDLRMNKDTFMIESSVNDKNKINRVTVVSPDNQPLNIITLKSVNDLPQNSVALSIDKYDDNEDDKSYIKSVVAVVAPDDQLLQMMNISNVDDSEFLSKLPQNAHYININDNVDENENDNNASNKIRLAVKSPDGQPLNVITITNEDEIPLNSTVIKNEEKGTIAIVSPDNQPLQLVTLKNGEKPPKNSYILPKKDSKSDENEYNYKLAVTSNNEEPLHIITLNENEEIPQNSMIIQSGDFGNNVAVSQDGKGIRLITINEDQNIPSNCIEIGSHQKKTDLCVVSPDSEPLQLITLKHGDELPENSFVIENDDDNVIAVTSNKPIQILSINEGDKVPKNAILIDHHSQKFAFTSPNGEPLNIMTIKANDEIPPNSKIIKKDDKTAIVISSPSKQPLLISTLKEGEEAPPNSFVFDEANKDDNNQLKIALFNKEGQQLNIITLKPDEDLPDNSILIKSDKESSIAISSPNSKPLRCITTNKNEEIPANSFVLDDIKSLLTPFQSPEKKRNYEYEDIEHTDEMNDNDYNNESEYDDNDNHSKFEVFNEISKNLTKNVNANDNVNTYNSPRIIVESNDKEPLIFFTLNDGDEIPKNSMFVSKSLNDNYPIYVASPNNNPLKFVTPDSFDKDRNQHSNAVDITQPNLFVVSSSDENKLKIMTIKKGETLPPNSAIISQDGDRIVVVVGDPDLTVNCLKPDQNKDELPPNSIRPLISSLETSEQNENDDKKFSSTNEIGSFRIAVFATLDDPLYLVTLSPDDQIPMNSIPIESDIEKVVYTVSTTKNPLNCQIIKQNDPIPEDSIIAFDPNDTNKIKKRIAIYTENRRQFHFRTLSKDDEIPSNSFIIKSDENYKEIISSPTNSPLYFYSLKDDEKAPENVFVGIINNDKNSNYDSDELFKNCAVSSYDNSPLIISMVKKGEKLPNNSAIITCEDNKVVALSTQSEFKPLLLHTNQDEVPENAVFLSQSERGQFAVSSKDGKQLSYTIVKNGFDGPFPKNSFIIDTEGGPNPRSLAVVAPEGEKLIYLPMRDGSRKLQKNSVIFGRQKDEINHSKVVVRGQDGKPLKFLTINENDEMPENSVVIHEEAGGKKVVVQASNKKPLQFMIIGEDDDIPRNAIQVEQGQNQIEQIVVMSSSYINDDTIKNAVSTAERINEPLQYVILKPNEEAPANAAVIKREGGKHPRRLAVKSPTGHSLKYVPIYSGDEMPQNSVTFCRQPSFIDSYINNNSISNNDEKQSIGVFNNTKKAVVAVTATDDEKPFQYIIAKFGDRLPKSMVALFKEGGDDARTVAINSADESTSPLRFFFVNPGCELPPNSVFLDESEVRKSITIAPGPSADPLLNFEEIEIGKEIPQNSIVVATIEKDGKTFRVIVRASDDSLLVPSLVRPGFEPRNALAINRKSGNDCTEDIFDQLNQLNILKEKRNRILSGQINSETSNDENRSSTVTQTSLSAEAFVKEALERFDLLLTNGENSLKTKKKKVTVKRKKKKNETTANQEIEEEEEVKSDEEKPSQTNSTTTTTTTNPPLDRIFAPKPNPNVPSSTFPDSEKVEANGTFEEEDTENTEVASSFNKDQTQQEGSISPVSKQQRTPITTLVMDKETMRKKFIKSPVKYDESLNKSNASSFSVNLSEFGNDSMKKKNFNVPSLNNSKIGVLSAREKREKNDSKIDSFRSLKISFKHKSDTLNVSDENAIENNKENEINNTSNINEFENVNKQNENEVINDDNNRHISKKSFTFSSQFVDDMDENNNQFQKIPFSGMTDLLHIDKDMVASSRQSSRSFSARANVSTTNSPKSPKSPKPPPIPQTPNSPKLPGGPNSVRFV